MEKQENANSIQVLQSSSKRQVPKVRLVNISPGHSVWIQCQECIFLKFRNHKLVVTDLNYNELAACTYFEFQKSSPSLHYIDCRYPLCKLV